MSLTIAPVAPQQTQAPPPLAQLLVPGATVEARVLQQMSAQLVRMVIAATAVDVLAPVPLPIGAKLTLAVAKGEGGAPQLTVVSSSPSATPVAGGQSAPVAQQGLHAALQGVVLKPVLVDPASAAQSPQPQSAPSSPAEAALAQAAQQAAPRQGGLSPLFADLNAALESGKLPPGVLQAAFSLMSMRPQLGEQLSAADIRNALQRSGLFLESSLAQGKAPATGSPDMKASLMVLREALSQWLGEAGRLPAAISQAAGALAQPASSASSQIPSAPAQLASLPAADAPALAVADADVQEIVIPRAPAGMPARPQDMPLASRAPIQSSVGAVLTFVQEIEQNLRDALARPGALQAMTAPESTPRAPLSQWAQSPSAPQTPPPPFRGSDPTPQPIASPSIAPDDPPFVMGHRLFEEADAAVARQTLFQIASMPEQMAHQPQRADQHARWAFEIPFASPQGTAVAQFEIERDAKKDQQAVEAVGPVWRARFTLNIEPAGPVHATITLTGSGSTTVRLWAERAETAAQLRDGTPLLSHALREAALEPGDITVGGAAPHAKPPAAGHFLDRAT